METDGWIRFNYDSGAADTALSEKGFAVPDLQPSGQSYKTASGEFVPDKGRVKISGGDENGHERSLTGRVAGVHKCLVSAAKVAQAGSSGWLSKEGGYLIPASHPVHKKVEKLLEKAAAEHKSQILPLYLERGVYNFYMKVKDAKALSTLGEGQAPTRETATKEEMLKLSKDELVEKLLGFTRQPGKGSQSHP